MADVAEGAGVGRATLYRYFSSRDELLRALSAAAVEETSARLQAADLEGVALPEALARMTRALMASGAKYAVIVEEPEYLDVADMERRVGAPIREVLQRGVTEGFLRADLTLDLLEQLWRGLVGGSLRSMRAGDLGLEGASAAVTSMFLTGAVNDAEVHAGMARG
jgi:AcrR family transcriptional regulator